MVLGGRCCVQECGAAVGLKWPNDLVDRELRKVGGILAEMETNGQTVQFVIVGFGVNVVSTPAAPNPVSLTDLGIMIEAEAFARRCATNLVQWVDNLSQSPSRGVAGCVASSGLYRWQSRPDRSHPWACLR